MRTTDLTLSIMIICIFILLYLFNIIIINIKRIKDNWETYRCQPLVMPFAWMFGHDTSKNFAGCIQKIQGGVISGMLDPMRANMSALGANTSSVSSDMNVFRVSLTDIREKINSSIASVGSIFFNGIIELSRTFVTLQDTVGKLSGTMVTILHLLSGSIMTVQSTWAGIPGDLVKALCFHPETRIHKMDGTSCAIREVQMDDVLLYNTSIISIMKINNVNKAGQYNDKMYEVPRKYIDEQCDKNADKNILVSGSHLIYNPNTRTFVKVKDFPSAVESKINSNILYCMITSTNVIPIGGHIFHDWEDNNGSNSKNIVLSVNK